MGRPLRELGVPAGAVVGGFIRDGEAFLPTGDTVFRGGDHLVVLAEPSVIEEIEGMFIG